MLYFAEKKKIGKHAYTFLSRISSSSKGLQGPVAQFIDERFCGAQSAPHWTTRWSANTLDKSRPFDFWSHQERSGDGIASYFAVKHEFVSMLLSNRVKALNYCSRGRLIFNWSVLLSWTWNWQNRLLQCENFNFFTTLPAQTKENSSNASEKKEFAQNICI